MSDPSSSTSTTSASSSSSSSSSGSSGNQSLRWSLQNFPVPLQLQARIPRSPLSVARELLPNFPSQLTPPAEVVEQLPQQYQMSIQQHVQQQLQQQFQRQLQLNLQGGGESSGAPVLPDPPDTILDLHPPPTSSSAEGGFGSGHGSSGTTSNSGGAFRSGLSSTGLLETLLRSAQAASSQQRNSGGSNSSSNSSVVRDGAGVGGTGSGSSLTSRTAPGLNLGHSLHSHSHHQPQGHSHHHRHEHSHSHGFQMLSSGGGGSGDGGSLPLTDGTTTSAHNTGGGTGAGTVASVVGAGAGDASAGGGPPAAELSLLYKWVAESGIFILLLLLHFLYDHRLGLLVFLCMGGTFYYTNMKLVHAIHQSAVRKQNISWLGLFNLAWLSGFLLLNIVILYYVFSEQGLWRLLFFQMAQVQDISVWTLLWCVVMTDYIVKFLTIMAKSIIAMMQPCCRNYRKRGKYYLLIESISQLYRQLVTVVPWLFYLNDSTRTSVWFAFATEIVYLCFKTWSVWSAFKFLYSALLRFSSNTSFGCKPSAQDMLERGSQCPICQDSVNEPVMLPCKHIFCEQCVSIWFDREKTCPMCRAQITTESPAWRDGNTSAHLQWH
ncbi:E3 ubiquitin-protein ligase RNFT1 [Aplysia californica]|uniref:E3 ubiquitin-protein ligase RNFT1 n=1 Tax=Aplysia californica TaxID=6500 RepID=A0ABM0ZXL9_APLCA|nr:E3 ubiquitin-protein ligase RNFT1 [Aplysia californica]